MVPKNAVDSVLVQIHDIENDTAKIHQFFTDADGKLADDDQIKKFDSVDQSGIKTAIQLKDTITIGKFIFEFMVG